MRFPFVLAPSLFLVLDDVAGSGAEEMLQRWAGSQARPAGPPLFTPDPLLLRAPVPLAELAAQHRYAVAPALALGRPVVVSGGPWRALMAAGCASAVALDDALAAVYGDVRPDLHVVFAGDDGRHPAELRAAAEQHTGLVCLRPGGANVRSLQVFDALARRGLYGRR
jgi:hypothetical protein